MSPSSEVRILDILQPDTLAFDAAHLLISQVLYKDRPGHLTTQHEVIAYLGNIDPNEETLYAIVNAESSVCAASKVLHNYQGYTTQVVHIAVQPGLQSNGLGRLLMGEIATRAQEVNDRELTAFAYEPKFFRAIGFTTLAVNAMGELMSASPAVVKENVKK